MATESLPKERTKKPHAPSLTIEGKKSKRISMFMPDDLMKDLKKDAEATGVAYSEIIRQVVEGFMKLDTRERRAIAKNVYEGRGFTDEEAKTHLAVSRAA